MDWSLTPICFSFWGNFNKNNMRTVFSKNQDITSPSRGVPGPSANTHLSVFFKGGQRLYPTGFYKRKNWLLKSFTNGTKIPGAITDWQLFEDKAHGNISEYTHINTPKSIQQPLSSPIKNTHCRGRAKLKAWTTVFNS